MAADVGHVLTGHAAIGQGQAMSQSLTATQHLRGGEQVGQQCMAGSPSRSHQHALQAWGTQDPSPTTRPAGPTTQACTSQTFAVHAQTQAQARVHTQAPRATQGIHAQAQARVYTQAPAPVRTSPLAVCILN